MNFVIVANQFFPQCDAESFCSTRFASALARAGHNVYVITFEYPRKVSDRVYDALVDSRLNIVRVPMKETKRGPFWSRLHYFTYEWTAVNFDDCIKATKNVLKKLDKPILVSRAFPIGSMIVAWHCRKFAYKWISHFSDPIPWFFWNSVCGRLRYCFERLWVRRSLRDADAYSVTCSQVCRFFDENYGELYRRKPTFVTTHIGDTALKTSRQAWSRKLRGKIIAHPGTLYYDRGAFEMADAVRQLNEEGIECTFALVGGGSDKQAAEMSKLPHVMLLNDFSPELSLSLTDAADVLYVSDFESSLPYSPRLMSKFVYQLFEDKPMVVRAQDDSAQHEYCKRYPNSGLFYADTASQRSLVDALKLALACDWKDINRAAIRRVFSAGTVAGAFVENVKSLDKTE